MRRALAALPTREERPAEYGAFFLGNHPVGAVPPEVAERLLKEPDASARDDRIVLEDPGSDAARDARWAALARDLRQESGLIPPLAWRDELLDVKDLDFAAERREGPSLGRCERALFRLLGMRTAAVHLIARPVEGEGFLLSKRSLTKAVGPGLWDALSAGMVAAGETPLAAMLREAHEEAGLMLNPESLRPLGVGRAVRRAETGWMDEVNFYSDVRLPEGTVFRNLDGEADDFRCFSPEETFEALAEGRLMWEAGTGILLALGALEGKR